jgi:hypothetical protein
MLGRAAKFAKRAATHLSWCGWPRAQKTFATGMSSAAKAESASAFAPAMESATAAGTAVVGTTTPAGASSAMLTENRVQRACQS